MIKHVTIVGSGALATFYAVHLAQLYTVTVLGTWVEGVEAISKNASIKNGDSYLSTDQVNGKLFSDVVQNSDLTIWITKTYKNPSSVKLYRRLKLKCPILIIQNGIDQKEFLEKELEEIKVYDAFTNQAAKLLSPGFVENTGEGQLFLTNDFPFLNELKASGLSVEKLADFEKMKLQKLAVNSVVNPLAALYKVKNGALQTVGLIDKVEQLIHTVYPYFETRKVFNSEDELRELIVKVVKKSKDNVNSMLADIETNRETEVNSILLPIQKELQSDYLNELITQLTW